MDPLSKAIDQRIGEVRFDSIDLSFGEIVSLHQARELIIQPEYQRLFRWSLEQRSRLVESILLELPIPQIFVIENETGILELIDGLQRVSSIIQFMNPDALELDPLVLQGCDLINELNDLDYENLPLPLRLQLKRSAVRTVIIKRQSRSFLRYEMFKRLNTGGSMLSHQEIRNCSSRMVGDQGRKFYEFIQQLANKDQFLRTIDSISISDLDQRGDEELVLRFFALKNYRDKFRGSVRDWLDSYMEAIIFNQIEFNLKKEERAFDRVFGVLDSALGEAAFVKYRNSQPIGSLAPAYFEAVTMGVYDNLTRLKKAEPVAIKKAVAKVLGSAAFKRFTGPGANTKPKMEGRISKVRDALSEI